MLLDKGIKNLKELSSVYKSESLTPSLLLDLFKVRKLLSVLKSQIFVKEKGMAVNQIIIVRIAFLLLNTCPDILNQLMVSLPCHIHPIIDWMN